MAPGRMVRSCLASYQRQSGGGRVPKERVCLGAFVLYVTLSLGAVWAALEKNCVKNQRHRASWEVLELSLEAVHSMTTAACSRTELQRAH